MPFAAADLQPDPCWFRLPPGFVDLDLTSLDETRDLVDHDIALLHPEDAVRGQLSQETEAVLGLLSDLHRQDVMHLAVGLHTHTEQTVSTSVLSFSDVRTGATTRTMAAARCGLHLATSRLGTAVRRELVELPCHCPAALVTRLLPDPPGGQEIDIPVREGHQRVFQARLAVARPKGSRLILIDLTTTTVELSIEYTEILLAIGHTLSFTDPTPQLPAQPRETRVWEVLL